MQQSPEIPPSLDLLYRNMMEQIEEVQKTPNLDILSATEKCISLIKEVIRELKDRILSKPFSGHQEEISFFKIIKPRFYSQLIYQLKVYRIEINRPLGSFSIQEKYVLKEMQKLKHFFDTNREFYQYFRSGATHHDARYFLRRKQDQGPFLSPFFFDVDGRFSTSHDFKVGKIMANELLSMHLKNSLEKLLKSENKKANNSIPEKPMVWTAPKAALIEIIYSLQSYGAFNNGAVDIKEVAAYLQETFHVELGNYYNCFQEIRLRKKSRTVFLDQLTEKLLQRMDEADEK